MITHKEYMADSSKLHHAYHLEIAQACGISYAASDRLPEIKAALANSDEHLNTIPLHIWDKAALLTARAVSDECKKRGTFYSLATGICVHKAAAKDAAKEAEKC